MSELVMGFQIRPTTTIRCDRCHKLIGRDAPQKIAYQIRDGVGKGTFCSGFCVNTARKEMLDAVDEDLNELMDMTLE